jgi:hypothetical protein
MPPACAATEANTPLVALVFPVTSICSLAPDASRLMMFVHLATIAAFAAGAVAKAIEYPPVT